MNRKKLVCGEYDEIFYKDSDSGVLSNHAFPLYLFTERLYRELEKSGCENVLFMAREGQFLKKLFDSYCSLRKESGIGCAKIKSHYFYGSRNSVMAASLKPLEQEDFSLLFRFFTLMSAHNFMHSIGFAKKQIAEVEQSYKANPRLCHLNFKRSAAFLNLKQNDVFKKIYAENRSLQRKAFSRYMESFGIDCKKEGLTFVDIGYHGTMQDLVSKFYDSQVAVKGYFVKSRCPASESAFKIGLLSDTHAGRNRGLDRGGLLSGQKSLFRKETGQFSKETGLFSKENSLSCKENAPFCKQTIAFSQQNSLSCRPTGERINSYDAYNYEQILRADHGRCLGYRLEGNVARPLLDSELDDKEVFAKYVKEVQDQIYEKFMMIARASLCKKDMSDICTAYYYFTIKNKSGADYDWFIDMQDTSHDDFGIVGCFGRHFSKGLRRFAFRLKDRGFVIRNSLYVRRLVQGRKETRLLPLPGDISLQLRARLSYDRKRLRLLRLKTLRFFHLA